VNINKKGAFELSLSSKVPFLLVNIGCVIEICVVIVHHASGRAFLVGSIDGGEHHFCPMVRHHVSGQNVFFQYFIEELGISVLIVRIAFSDKPAVYGVSAASVPPTVSSRNINNTVCGSFHSRSTACLKRNLRIAKPNIATLSHNSGDISIVVLQEHDILRVFLGHLIKTP